MEDTMKKYQIIYADPPWGTGYYFRSAGVSYPLLSPGQIADIPVETIAHPDALLFLWTTMHCIPDALNVIEAWGFAFVTNGFTWIKTNPKSRTPFVGLGSWTRHNAELCLLAKRGRPARASKAVRSLVVAPRERHSKKPQIVRDRIVQLCGNLPRIELFARAKTPGWDVWGNELANDLDLDALASHPRPATGGRRP